MIVNIDEISIDRFHVKSMFNPCHCCRGYTLHTSHKHIIKYLMLSVLLMMTSSNGKKIPRYWPFTREITGHWWIPITKTSDTELWCSIWSAPEQTAEQTIGDLRNHRAHYDVTVMSRPFCRRYFGDHKVLWYLHCICRHCKFTRCTHLICAWTSTTI